MLQPLISLTVFFVLAWFAWFLFWPERGKFWQWQRMRQITERVLIEDILKHVFEYEYEQKSANIQAISKHLEMPLSGTEAIIARIQEKQLASVENGNLRLTKEGRDYALRIIRAHRLWEKFLSEKTGFSEKNWHLEAERREHSISEEEANRLAYALGNPLFDPHGDPIPNEKGDYIANCAGIPLLTLNDGDIAEICHIEDEPVESFQQVSSLRLAPGKRIQIIEKKEFQIRIWSDNEEYVLNPIQSGIINVTKLEEPEALRLAENAATLSSLIPGEIARVLKLSPACRGIERRRLMDFGIVPGTEISPELQGLGGDPVAYRVRGTLVALRKEQANLIYVQKEKEVA